ncbi:MAG: tetratricopeptide repeat protein [Asticcacaulis sp.]|nr:tetratricopeptide repeat protein [Asticcacaulis sp.]
MSSVSSAAVLAMIGVLAAAPAFAQGIVSNAGATPLAGQQHSFVPAFDNALRGHGPVSTPIAAASGIADASDATAMDFPVDGVRRTAEERGQDVVATTTICEGYFDQSQALTPTLAAAFKSMAAGDKASLQVLLPTMQKQLDGLLPYEIKPEVCGGDHINTYSSYQFFTLNQMRADNVNSGFPANLPIVKQPDINQSALAYAVGWTQYELGDFDGALAAYGKGLAMFPHQHTLQQEYVATLFQLKRAAQALSYIDSVLGSTYDLSDEERAKMFQGRGVALLMGGALDPAIDSLNVAQRYHYTEETGKLIDQLEEIKAQAAKK